jgi:hypothetical protein
MAANTKLPYKTKYPEEDHGEVMERIVIERREIIGEIISSPNGNERMVVAAFLKAGQYLDELASQGADPARIEFEYKGTKFTATYGEIDS